MFTLYDFHHLSIVRTIHHLSIVDTISIIYPLFTLSIIHCLHYPSSIHCSHYPSFINCWHYCSRSAFPIKGYDWSFFSTRLYTAIPNGRGPLLVQYIIYFFLNCNAWPVHCAVVKYISSINYYCVVGSNYSVTVTSIIALQDDQLQCRAEKCNCVGYFIMHYIPTGA